METIKKDPLLITAKVLTTIVRFALVFGMVMLGIGIIGVALASLGWLPAQVLEGITVETDGVLTSGNMWVIMLPLLGALVMVCLTFDFVTRLAQMIDTVGVGDPFTMANSVRLTRMAWLALSVELVSLITSFLGDWVEQRFEPADVEFNIEFSLTGIVLALVLFILARVFRQGAQMRDELEGTV